MEIISEIISLISELIKRFIKWLISLFKKKKKKKKKKVVRKPEYPFQGNPKVANINGIFDSTLPVYMFIGNNERDKLIYRLGLLKNVLIEEREKEKELKEKELINLIEDKCNIKVSELLDQKYIDTITKELETEDRKEIVNKYQDIIKRDIDFKKQVNEIDKAIAKISDNKISIMAEDEIDREVTNFASDKHLIEDIDKKIDDFNLKVFDIVENFDKRFLDDVIREYGKVNYITITTEIIDKNYERLKKIEEDFKSHRYNRYYYEREINKIKYELNQIKNLKNKKEVSEHIEKLKRELYTKSKDKYDLLYNNEVFIDIDKRCDMLLENVNAKVVDIREKKVEKEKETKEKENKEKELEEEREQYYENVILRFQDLTLSQKLIQIHQEMQKGNIDKNHIDIYLEDVYEEFLNGVDGKFNYERNKVRTELVNLYNDLNSIIAKKENKPFDPVDHANFLMEDLVEAVTVKKEEVEEGILQKEKTPSSDLVDEKINNIKEKYIENTEEKVFTKSSRRAA